MVGMGKSTSPSFWTPILYCILALHLHLVFTFSVAREALPPAKGISSSPGRRWKTIVVRDGLGEEVGEGSTIPSL